MGTLSSCVSSSSLSIAFYKGLTVISFPFLSVMSFKSLSNYFIWMIMSTVHLCSREPFHFIVARTVTASVTCSLLYCCLFSCLIATIPRGIAFVTRRLVPWCRGTSPSQVTSMGPTPSRAQASSGLGLSNKCSSPPWTSTLKTFRLFIRW